MKEGVYRIMPWLAKGHPGRRVQKGISRQKYLFGRGCFLQSTDDLGAQVALLQSPILRDRKPKILPTNENAKSSKTVTYVPGRKCYPCIGTLR